MRDGVGHVPQRGDSGSSPRRTPRRIAVARGAPVRPTAPRAGPESHEIHASRSVHVFFSSPGVLVLTSRQPFRNRLASKATCFRHRWYTVRPIFASRIARALLLPRFFLPLHPRLRRRQRSQHQARRLGERPLQVRVADLLAARALHLPGALVRAAHQPGVRQEVADLGEAARCRRSRRAGPAPGSARCPGRCAAGRRSTGSSTLAVFDQVRLQRRRSARRRRRSGPGRRRCSAGCSGGRSGRRSRRVRLAA